jgi:hypothetical protein
VTRSRGPALPAHLQALLSQSDLPSRLDRAIPVVTLDAEGRPHPMICSYLECLAVDARTIRVVIGARSGSARNLEARQVATLLIVEPERTVYVKCRAAGRPVSEGVLACFTLGVEEVLEDAPAEWEAGARITGGITYAPAPDLTTPEAQVTLRLLRSDHRPGSD